MDKTYQPSSIESRLYHEWEKSNAFCPTTGEQAYCIILPPPNITGTLHMGHAFQVALMDCLVRYQRMRGKKVLWQAGTDHAGIATQMVVERQLEQQTNRHTIGREQFIEKIWAWKDHSGNTITQQLRRLGASLDWSRERFTMDETSSRAVQHAFITLYQQGLIIRGKRLVNWDPVLHTAISDLEVVSKEEEGSLWHIRYPLADQSQSITVETTRPETLFGDVAVAVHPDDIRYQSLIGKELILPISQRHIPIIADNDVDPEFGTGCVKITPAHDFNDYQIGKRHQLSMINILNPDATLNDNVPTTYQKLDRYVARKKIIEELEQEDLLASTEKHIHTVPYGDRSNSVIEPYLTDQWFVKTEPLAKAAIDVVNNGDIQFYPNNWTKVYLDWMHNIEDWCISRQIWWGHRIPAWYSESGDIYVAESLEEAIKQSGLSAEQLRQDDDVLDTWFSSALWPFSTQGWPKQTDALNTFYPTSVLVTGFDIIFFWAARMIMMGLHFTGKVPFREVYIHGLVRDSEGQKMSKSKGNVLDPLDLIDGISGSDLLAKQTQNLMQPQMAKQIKNSINKNYPDGIKAYGTDALRFTFIAMAATGRDIKFDINRIEGYRNFCNKLWNASRFTVMICDNHSLTNNEPSQLLADKWINAQLNQLITDCHSHIANYRFDLLGNAIYHFVWHDLCDWYLEFIKCIHNGNYDNAQKSATRNTLINTLETTLRLLHPITPYISEEIWQNLKPLHTHNEQWLQQRPFPETSSTIDNVAITTMKNLQAFISAIRGIRSKAMISPNTHIDILLKDWNTNDQQLFEQYGQLITTLCNITDVKWLDDNQPVPLSATEIVGQTKVLVPLEGLIDIDAERSRLQKEIERMKKLLEKTKAQVENADFVSKAPPQVVETKRIQVQDFEDKISKYQEQLTTLIK